jgi:hypothetical protein
LPRGEYTYTVKFFHDDPSIAVNFLTDTIKVNPLPLSITTNSNVVNKDYMKQDVTKQYAVNSLYSGGIWKIENLSPATDEITINANGLVTFSKILPIDVYTYEVAYVLPESVNPNYQVINLSQTFTVKKLIPEFNATNAKIAYKTNTAQKD